MNVIQSHTRDDAGILPTPLLLLLPLHFLLVKLHLLFLLLLLTFFPGLGHCSLDRVNEGDHATLQARQRCIGAGAGDRKE